MSAKEIFEKLGYKLIEQNNYLMYVSKYDNSFTFFKDKQEFNCNRCSIYFELNKTIQKQIEELGWEE